MSEQIGDPVALDRPQKRHLVRGHHFQAVLDSYGQGKSAAYVAHDIRLYAQQARRDSTSQTVDFSTLDTGVAEDSLTEAFDRAYGVDVIGDTDEQADAVERQTAAALQRFHDLQPSDIVEVGVGILDDQCDSCFFKRHCHNTTEASLRPDYDALRTIEKVADHLGAAAMVSVTGQEGDLGSYRLTTSAGLMRDIVYFFQGIDGDTPGAPFAKAAWLPGYDLFDPKSQQ